MTQAGVAIVTGASRGIGAEIAKRLAAQGIAVVVNYAATKSGAEQVVEEIRESGGRAFCWQADVSEAAEARRLYEVTEKEFGPVTILVNNAGVAAPRMMNLIETDDDTFEHLFEVNTRGTFHMLREAGRRMTSGGCIVNFSSTVVNYQHPGFAVYAGSKAAIEAMSTIFAQELRGREIRVNCVSPGPVATDFFREGKTEETIDYFAKLAPFERLGSPQEIANVVAFLVGPDATWVNGQVIRVNGGVI